MRRRFITKTEIDDLAERGERLLRIDDRTTVTDLAREHAQHRGVRLVRAADGDAVGATDPAGVHSGERGPADETDEIRGAVRSAVIGRLGEVPAGLDDVIARVLGAPPP